jgi:hypothetical protein
MSDDGKLAVLLLVLVASVFMLGVLLTSAYYEAGAIEAGVGEFNSVTGNFQYKGE